MRIFFKKLKNLILDILKTKNKRATLITYIVLPIALNIIIEMFSRKSIIKGFVFPFTEPVPFICNSFIILLTLMISAFFRRRTFCLVFISFIWLLLGFVNFILLSNRVTPFSATDILLMAPAVAVVKKYYSNLMIGLAIAGIILLLGIIGFLWFKAPKLKYKVKYLRNAILTAVVALLTVASLDVSVNAGFLSIKFDNLANAYKDYGFVYCFTNSVFNTGVSKPADYSAEKIAQIVSETETQAPASTTVSASESKPNIIFVQLESFFDINRLDGLTLSENPIPNFTNLKANYPSGYFSVPIIGAGTANTEFEVLTGMNLDDFGPGEYPYKTVLQSTTAESIAYNLKSNGYSTHAIHNNAGTFYERYTVFSQLGFDTFTPIEYMNNLEFTYKHWAKDNVLTGEIMKSLNSTPDQSDFVFTITVEGHGSYPGAQVLEDPAITVTSINDEAKRYSFEYYVNMLKGTDNFIGDLTNTLMSYDEPVIVVFYGDHLPSLGIGDTNLNSGVALQTDYVIWSNMGLTISNEDIEAYQISSKICGLLGINTGLINKYHQTHKGTEEYLDGLQNLEYDILYGDKKTYNGVNPYVASNLQMGVSQIKITQVSPDTEDVSKTIIKGENFTQYSVVYVNDKRIPADDTEFIDQNTIKIKYTPSKNDVIKIGQQGSDNVVLSYTDDYIYN